MDKIEAHLHKEDLQADLRHDKVYNPFSEDSKKMILRIGQHRVLRILRNRFQGTLLLLSVLLGTRNLYSCCGLCLKNTEEVRKLNQGRFDALSISNWMIRKKSVHGVRHGKSEVENYYYQPFNVWKRCQKQMDESGIHQIGILDRFLKDATYRESHQKLGWTEAKCQEMDDLAHSIRSFLQGYELDRYRSHCTLQLNDLTFNGTMALRDDYKAAVSLTNHMYTRSEDYQKPIPPQYQDRQRRGCKFSDTHRQGPNIG